MKAFIDSSSLIKRYINEEGSAKLDALLEKIKEITISPVYQLEVNSAIERRLREKTLSSQQANWIRKEVKKDLRYFNRVRWNDALEEKSLEIIQKHRLKTLDCLQLASGYFSNPDIFITSDKKLFKAAKKEIKNVKLI